MGPANTQQMTCVRLGKRGAAKCHTALVQYNVRERAMLIDGLDAVGCACGVSVPGCSSIECLDSDTGEQSRAVTDRTAVRLGGRKNDSLRLA